MKSSTAPSAATFGASFILGRPFAAEVDFGAKFQRWIANPDVKQWAVILLAVLFFLIFLGAQALLSRRRRF